MTRPPMPIIILLSLPSTSVLAAAATVTGFYRTAIGDEEAYAIVEMASRKALDLDPGSGLALAVRAMAAYGRGRNPVEGFRLIDRAVDEAPHDTTVRLWAGMYYWYWGYLEQAHAHFLYVYRHDPRVGISNGSLGLLYLVQGREDLAAPLLARATELGSPPPPNSGGPAAATQPPSQNSW